MKASIEAQVIIRRNFEEQSNALDDFKAWETQIKLDDAKRKRSSRKANEESNGSSSVLATSFLVKGSKEERTNDAKSQLPPMLQKSASIVIGGSGSNVQMAKNAVPIAPIVIDGYETKSLSKEKLAIEERERGNELFAEGDFEGAKKCYSQSIHFNASSALAYSNRAMANLKLKDWRSAESDASIAIGIDDLHLKSYQRRSAARLSLGKVRASLKDLHAAKSTLSKLKQIATERSDQSSNLPQDINMSVVEKELLKIMKNAPRRKVNIRVQKSSGQKKGPNSISATKKLNNEAAKMPMSTTVRRSTKNWVEFEQVWKSLTSSHEKITFLKSLNAVKFHELYKNGMEDSCLLLDLIIHCSKFQSGLSMIRDISKIPSIDMLLMMLSTKEKELFTSHMEDALSSCKRKDEVITIKRNFGLKL